MTLFCVIIVNYLNIHDFSQAPVKLSSVQFSSVRFGSVQFSSVQFSIYIQIFPRRAFQWPITGSIHLVVLVRLFIFTTMFFTFLTLFILTHPFNFPVGGNWSSRRKPKTFGRALTDSFHIRPVARIEPTI